MKRIILRIRGVKLVSILLAILILLLAARIAYIDNPPYEQYEMWRQSDTETMAKNFLTGHFNILYPQLNYDGPAPNYAQLELQITTFLIAILYKLFGYHEEFARLVPILFFLGSASFLFLIANAYYGRLAASYAALLYGFYPVMLFFSRAVMPESAALFFYLGAFYFFYKWIRGEKLTELVLAAIFTALAISIKIPAVFVGIPMLALAIVKFRWKIFKQLSLYLFVLVALLPPFFYFKWLEGIAAKAFVSAIASNHIFAKVGSAFFSAEAITFYTTKMPEALTWIGIVLFLIALVTASWRKEFPLIIWSLAMIVEVLMIVSVIRFNYYLVFIAPVMALLSGRLLAEASRRLAGQIGVVVFLVLFIAVNYKNVLPWFQLSDNVLRQAAVVKEVTEEGDLLLIGTLGPELLNASDRKGWRFHLPNDKGDLTSAARRMEEYIEQGAMYFVPAGTYIFGDKEQQFRNYLEENFEKIDRGDHSIYKLQ